MPGLRPLCVALRRVLYALDGGSEDAIQAPVDVADLDPFEGVSDRLLALLANEPRRRALGQLYVVLGGQRDHRLPQLSVVATVKLEVHDVAAAPTAVAPPPSRWV